MHDHPQDTGGTDSRDGNDPENLCTEPIGSSCRAGRYCGSRRNRSCGLAPVNESPHVGDIGLPERIARVSLPLRKVGRVRQLEHHRTQAVLDHDRDQGLVRSAVVASARTQRESTDARDQSTTTAFASRSAFSVTWS